MSVPYTHLCCCAFLPSSHPCSASPISSPPFWLQSQQPHGLFSHFAERGCAWPTLPAPPSALYLLPVVAGRNCNLLPSKHSFGDSTHTWRNRRWHGVVWGRGSVCVKDFKLLTITACLPPAHQFCGRCFPYAQVGGGMDHFPTPTLCITQFSPTHLFIHRNIQKLVSLPYIII